MGNRGLVFDGRTLFVAVAALLVWAMMAAPAFAQGADAEAGDDGAHAGDVDFQAVDCSQVQAALAGQYNSGNAVAVQYDSGTATAEIAQALGIDQSQVNECLANSNGGGTSSNPKSPGEVDNPKGVIKDTASAIELPNTGGAPLSGAVAGFALVAAGILSVGLIVRRGR